MLWSQFDLPDYYGCNMDALWDCLQCSFAKPTTIVLNNLSALPKDMRQVIPTLKRLFRELEAREKYLIVSFNAVAGK